MARLAYDEGHAARRRHRRANCTSRSAAGVPAVGVRAARQQQVASPNCGDGDRRRRAAHRGRLVRRARSPRRARRRRVPDRRPTSCCGSRPASTPTRTSSSPPGRTTRSSVSTSATATPLRAVDRARRSSSVELVGLHCHIGSNVFEASSFAKAAEVMADFAVPLDLARAGARRRPRCGVRGERGSADDHAVGQRRCSTPATHSACGRG